MAVITPWPTSPAALLAATAYLRRKLPAKLDDDRVQSLGAVSAALVERYAPGAPQVIRNEAAIRFAGYLGQAASGTVTKIGFRNMDIEFITNHAAMFRNSGAAGLLSPWKRRRAGIIGIGADPARTVLSVTTPPEKAMARQQIGHIEITESPVDISAGLDPGRYAFQASIDRPAVVVILYAYGAGAPADEADYFTLDDDQIVEFVAPGGLWVRVMETTNDYTAKIAISTA